MELTEPKTGQEIEAFPETRQTRIVLFDIVRIIAVGLVIFVHLLQRQGHPWGRGFGIPGFYYVTLGGVGVTLCVILSGMVLEYNYGHHELDYFSFVLKRAKRIYPIYWLSVLLALILLGSTRLTNNFFGYLLDLSGFLAFTGQPWSRYILPTGWFIGVIFSLYLSFPYLSKYIRAYPRTSLILLFAVSGASRYLTEAYTDWSRPADWFILCRLFEFGLGIWLVDNPKALNIMKSLGQDLKAKTKTAVIYASNLSFPAYLVHWIAIEMSPFKTMELRYFLIFFFIFTLTMSWLVLTLNRVIRGTRRFQQAPA